MCLCSSLYTHVLNSSLGFSPDSAYFKAWRRTQTPPYMEIYLFNWTNPEDGHNENIKPRFTEIGPFKFKEYKEKFNITFNANNTISFRQKKVWYFDEEASCCSLDVNVTTLNAVLVTLSHKAKGYSMVLKMGLSFGLRAMSPNLHVTKTARELLFEGYVDNLLATLKNTGMASLPDKFGFFHGKNDTSRDGYYNMDTHPSAKGLIRKWNHETDTTYFEGACSKVHGTTAEMYPPGRDQTSVAFFSGDMCRQLKLDYDRDESFYGLGTYRFIANTSLLDNGTLIPENSCYCNGKCMPSGVMNISACREGSPTFISMPHFLNADPVYLDAVEGLSPDPDKHQLYQLVEPNTGLVVEAAIRIQMNFHLKPIAMMPIINDVPNVMFPILWFQTQAKGTPEVASKLSLLLNLPAILQGIAYTVIVISVLMILVGLYLKRKEATPILPEIHQSEAVPLKKSDFDSGTTKSRL